MSTPSLFDINTFTALVSALIPILVGFVTARSFPAWVKGGLFLVFSLIASVVGLSLENKLSWDTLPESFFAIALLGQVWYQTVLKEASKKLQDVGPVKDPPADMITLSGRGDTDF